MKLDMKTCDEYTSVVLPCNSSRLPFFKRTGVHLISISENTHAI